MKKGILCGTALSVLMLMLIPATQAVNAQTVQQSIVVNKILSSPLVSEKMKEKISTYLSGNPSLDALLLALVGAGLCVIAALILYIYITHITPKF